VPEVRAVVHLHGAKAPTKDDGYPENWYVPGESRRCHYPLEQEAAMLWYHDHAMGLNRLNIYAGLRTRTIQLNDMLNGVGNSMVMLLNHQHWHEPVTEQPRLNSTETWEFVNLTEDTHPMHLHLVRIQVLDRRVFDVFAYRKGKELRYLAAMAPPEANEMGWKDTVQCPAGMITRIIMRFEGYTGKYLSSLPHS
jgi:FtsP/CotA-like multicopper oxidase with cupredoxin domain